MNLKHFIVQDISPNGVWATLECPRSDCGGLFQVERGLFKSNVPGGTHKPTIDTRPCPYCFRVSIRPKRAPMRKKRVRRKVVAR